MIVSGGQFIGNKAETVCNTLKKKSLAFRKKVKKHLLTRSLTYWKWMNNDVGKRGKFIQGQYVIAKNGFESIIHKNKD